MLSRTADHLFWMSRYTERAENTARMLDVNYQTSLLPQSAAVARVGWQGLLSISELLPAYNAKYGDIVPRDVMEFMVKDEKTRPPSSPACVRPARTHVRCVAHSPPRPGRRRTRPGWKPAACCATASSSVTLPSSSTG